MRINDLKDKRVIIWGTGQEGRAAASLIRRFLPHLPLVFIDEAAKNASHDSIEDNNTTLYCGADIEAVLDAAEVLIKSPGVSLYHPLIQRLQKREVPITSLLNLWVAENATIETIFVTGTKGKSTTAALMAHMLNKLGKTAALLGNIGVPVTEIIADGFDYAVVEISSYQAANFEGVCDIALLVSLYPEHFDWHKTLHDYYKDKLQLLSHARTVIVNAEAKEEVLKHTKDSSSNIQLFNHSSYINIRDGQIYNGDVAIGHVRNEYLARPHNLINLCAVLTVLDNLGLDLNAALLAAEDFRGLPHRQYELGIKDDVLYVDDSISTTPQSAIAALEAYRDKMVTLIVGGYDRGIDYAQLADYLAQNSSRITTVICLGASGRRIAADILVRGKNATPFFANSMKEAVAIAKKNTPQGGLILLSPAAPSYGMFKNFVERGEVFAAEAGFIVSPTVR